MISLEHVSKTYEAGIPALDDISLHIEPGEFVFITGASGSGKSTLIKLMLNELKAYKNLDVYVTGSNSKGLSSDIATEPLRWGGRT